MKKILVPCDFSKPAINAFRFALSIAELSKGAINLINVIELPVLVEPILIPMPDYEEGLKLNCRKKLNVNFKRLLKNTIPKKYKSLMKFCLVFHQRPYLLE